MRMNIINKLTESAISTTDLALNVEGMSDQIQSMIEKITNIKTKDLAVLVKKIKYDGSIEEAEQFQQNIGAKLDQLLQSMTDIKGEIDNVTVGMLNGDENLGGESSDEGLGDFEDDFNEFNADETAGEGLDSETEMDTNTEESGESLDDLTDSLESLSREAK